MTDRYLTQFQLSVDVPYSERLDRLSRWKVMQPIVRLTNEEAISYLVKTQLDLQVAQRAAKGYASQLFNNFIRQGWVLVGRDEFALAMHAVSSAELLHAANVGKTALERIEITLERLHAKRQ